MHLATWLPDMHPSAYTQNGIGIREDWVYGIGMREKFYNTEYVTDILPPPPPSLLYFILWTRIYIDSQEFLSPSA